MAGQGTAAVEVLEQLQAASAAAGMAAAGEAGAASAANAGSSPGAGSDQLVVYIPVGGGGLIGGMSSVSAGQPAPRPAGARAGAMISAACTPCSRLCPPPHTHILPC